MSEQSTPSNPDRSAFLKPFWTHTFGPPWRVSLLLLAVLEGVRYFAVFSPYPAQALFFLQYAATWAVPFIFLTSNGRFQIGLRERGASFRSLGLGALAGAAYALPVFVLGMVLYGDSPDNWCISLRDYMRLNELRGVMHPAAVFALFSVPAILFAPIGDEILFRGLIHQAFERRWNRIAATAVNCTAYGFTYLYFHAIWMDGSGIHFRLISGLLSVVLLMGAGVVFTVCRLLCGSLWAAVAAHAAFNLTMLGASIVYYMR